MARRGYDIASLLAGDLQGPRDLAVEVTPGSRSSNSSPYEAPEECLNDGNDLGSETSHKSGKHSIRPDSSDTGRQLAKGEAALTMGSEYNRCSSRSTRDDEVSHIQGKHILNLYQTNILIILCKIDLFLNM